MKDMMNDILNLVQKSKEPLDENDIARLLQLRGGARSRLGKELRQLVVTGEVVLIRKNKYSLGTLADLLTGALAVVRSGNGFVATKDGKDDVFVPSRDLGTALPGDIVTVRLDTGSKKGDRRRGKVVSIIERKRHDIVGTLKSTGRLLHVVPMNPSYGQNFYVTGGIKAKLGDRVVIRFTGWENKHVNPEGELIETLGPAENPSLDTLSIVRHYGFHTDFPEGVVTEAEQASSLVSKAGKRRDMRDVFTLTVDPASAKDFDDALSLEVDDQGRRVLGVHIADVCHFVKQGSTLDKEARARGNSVYLADMTIPMLPVQLSNGVCSLKPDEDRLAFSVFLTVDAGGNVVASNFAKTIIRSRLRLTYTKAFSILSDNLKLEGEQGTQGMDLLKKLHKLSQQIRKKRLSKWALELDIPEVKLIIAKDGTVSGTRIVENDISHQLIEEAMISANEAVGAELKKLNIPLVSRLHEPPADAKIEALTAELQGMGHTPGDLSQRKVLSEFLAKVKDDPLAKVIRVAVLRSMSRAVYSAAASGHYGLAKKSYAHFTSPIRRYPDLVVHRQLQSTLLASSKAPYQRAELNNVAFECTDTERTADEAERALTELKIYRMLEAEMKSGEGQLHDGVIVTVLNRGMYVELDGLQVQGLVHISHMSDGFVRFDQARGLLRAGKKTYAAGQIIKVAVAAVDIDGRRLDFALENQKTPQRKRRPNNKKQKANKGTSPRRHGGGNQNSHKKSRRVTKRGKGKK
jgi:ribonuclease R